MRYAHYFKTNKQHSVTISDTPRPVGVVIKVASKTEARAVAKQHNAKAWNF